MLAVMHDTQNGSRYARGFRNSLLLRLAHQVADHLTHAFMIKNDGKAAWGDIDGDAIADDQRAWMIDLKSVAIYQRYSKRSERSSFPKSRERVVEVFRLHGRVLV